MPARTFGDVPPPYGGADAARVVVLPVPYEKTVSYGKGTGKGPAAIIDASTELELYDDELGTETYKIGIHTAAPVKGKEKPEVYLPRLTKVVESWLQRGKFLVSLGGEHSITAGIIPPFARRWTDLSVLQFDAHADLRPHYHGTRFNHACAMDRVADYCPVVGVGIRSLAVEDLPRIRDGRYRMFPAEPIVRGRVTPAEIVRSLTPSVYISIDVDGFDPSLIPGTGTPVPGGLGWYDGLDILREVFRTRTVVGCDINEVAPLPHSPRSEFTAAKLAYRMMGYQAQAQGWLTRTAADKRSSAAPAGRSAMASRPAK